MKKRLCVGIVGLGCVGSAVVKILEDNKEIIRDRAGVEIVIKKAIVRDVEKYQGYPFEISNDLESLVEDTEIDIVIELMGGVEVPYELAKKTLVKQKAFVTANKAMLAYHRYELEQIAQNTPIGFEASVCGGIPVIKALKDGLSANHILSLKGILNGTSNYILTQMFNHNRSFKDALKDAQDLGYAEMNPEFDIKGIDAAHKLLILASLAYGIDARLEEILIEGIEKIEQDDIDFAKEFGYNIKLLGVAKKHKDCIELRVHPSMIKNERMLSKVDGVMNAISIVGDKVGETLYYGAGAGGEATASAVISDIIEIAREKSSLMLGFECPQSLPLKPQESIESAYYVRLLVNDEKGVLSQISAILAQNDISLNNVLQKEISQANRAKILLSTHLTNEKTILNALKELENLSSVLDTPKMIRLITE
ncbi:homoserine dehydrogenase [Helicobacter cetorum]|uniref:Homoserine dehydrogenase n=1 Tax=Helicobacter cetorum (strain ATCC BAA-429 / MIT 00-7128) TaxID=182217 RepID=I0ENP4_HELC0|nr:homoserine dehydrogenase [Helicobacter cetorum]AFI04563.1 homoserine dehydrogenase [Helicobacter cetorum MIT 00-7128]